MHGTARSSKMAGAFSAWRLALVIAIAVGALVACGGSSEPARAPTAPAAAPDSSAAPSEMPVTTAPPAAKASDPNAWPFGPAPSAEERDAQLDRLKKDPGPIRSNWVPPGRSERYGHAEGLIAAPPAAVRARLGDFTHYKDLAGPKFKTVRVVDKQPETADLYFQLPIMKGLVTIWYVTRFANAKPAAGGAEVIEGSFVKGNIRGMHIAFTTRPGGDDKSTVLVCDLLLSLSIPAPQGPVDEELRDACGDAINAVRAKLAAQ